MAIWSTALMHASCLKIKFTAARSDHLFDQMDSVPTRPKLDSVSPRPESTYSRQLPVMSTLTVCCKKVKSMNLRQHCLRDFVANPTLATSARFWFYDGHKIKRSVVLPVR